MGGELGEGNAGRDMEALTPAQRERISQNFRAAKALLARKRPLEIAPAPSAEKFVPWTLFLMFLKLIESFFFFGIVSHKSMSVCGFFPEYSSFCSDVLQSD